LSLTRRSLANWPGVQHTNVLQLNIYRKKKSFTLISKISLFITDIFRKVQWHKHKGCRIP
jgi:hypothetical protein